MYYIHNIPAKLKQIHLQTHNTFYLTENNIDPNITLVRIRRASFHFILYDCSINCVNEMKRRVSASITPGSVSQQIGRPRYFPPPPITITHPTNPRHPRRPRHSRHPAPPHGTPRHPRQPQAPASPPGTPANPRHPHYPHATAPTLGTRTTPRHPRHTTGTPANPRHPRQP